MEEARFKLEELTVQRLCRFEPALGTGVVRLDEERSRFGIRLEEFSRDRQVKGSRSPVSASRALTRNTGRTTKISAILKNLILNPRRSVVSTEDTRQLSDNLQLTSVVKGGFRRTNLERQLRKELGDRCGTVVTSHFGLRTLALRV